MQPKCSLCSDEVRPLHLCPECGLYDPNDMEGVGDDDV